MLRLNMDLLLLMILAPLSALTDFNGGHIIRALLYPLTSVFGTGLSYGLIIAMLFGVIYLGSDNLALPVAVFIILWPVMSWFLPESTWYVFGGFVGASIGFVFAKAFTRRS